jgi:hypothetical protein
MQSIFELMKAAIKPLAVTGYCSGDLSYERDKDFVANDFQAGDNWYWRVSTGGSVLLLIKPHSQALTDLLAIAGDDSFHFIINVSSVHPEGASVQQYKACNLEGAFQSCRYNAYRKSKRKLATALLKAYVPDSVGTQLVSDFDFEKGSILYFSMDANSMSYFSCSGSRNVVALPFDAYRQTGCFRLTMTSNYGHAELQRITRPAYQRAQKAKKAA